MGVFFYTQGAAGCRRVPQGVAGCRRVPQGAAGCRRVPSFFKIFFKQNKLTFFESDPGMVLFFLNFFSGFKEKSI
jgi:hypothetical protein